MNFKIFEVNVADILELVGCEMFFRKLLKRKENEEFTLTADYINIFILKSKKVAAR